MVESPTDNLPMERPHYVIVSMAGAFVLRKMAEYLFVWLFGGIAYYDLEILFRGFSHWTMIIVGGLCFLFAYLQGKHTGWKEPLWRQVLWCSVFITSAEFISGIIVNQWLHYMVWDYSRMPAQLWGQICVPFMLIFAGLSLIAIFLGGEIGYYLFGTAKPEYHIL